MKKQSLILIAVLLALVSISIYSYLSEKSVKKTGVFSIAILRKVEGAKSGRRVWFDFKYQGEIQHIDFITGSDIVDGHSIGKRYFIQFNRNNPEHLVHVYFNYELPDFVDIGDNGVSLPDIEKRFPFLIPNSN